MSSFVDSKGRAWNVELNISKLRKLREANIHLSPLGRDVYKQLGDVLDDLLTFGDVMWLLCQKQAEAMGVSNEDFLDSLTGDVLDAAQMAFVEAFIDMAPSSGQREAMRETVAQSRAGRDAANRFMIQEVRKLDPEQFIKG